MDPNSLNAYYQKRKNIIKEYRAKKYKNVLLVLSVGFIAVGLILLVGGVFLKNIPITAVLTLIAVLFTVIYARIRAVTVEHTLQKKLLLFEEDY